LMATRTRVAVPPVGGNAVRLRVTDRGRRG
jgi:hypothetical protein